MIITVESYNYNSNNNVNSGVLERPFSKSMSLRRIHFILKLKTTNIRTQKRKREKISGSPLNLKGNDLF